MLFNTYSFIFYFLIPVIITYYGLIYLLTDKIKFKLSFLITVSIIFYAQWDIIHLLILLCSIFINFNFVKYILKQNKINLFMLIILNILPLIYFKYSGFLNLTNDSIVLPLAISFFTFQQIAYGVDVYRVRRIKIRGGTKINSDTSLIEYMFFVLFFPQLIAGPIVHYNEMMQQIDKQWANKINFDSLKAGIVLFCFGLFSKVVIADSLIKSSYDSWADLFFYSFMIYFDFSGYASMAIGLALMFGIILPINFNSPYKARNLIDFWRRWHITLSNFLKDHIYIPLGGNRSGVKIQIIALMSTMIIGGIWHGAGWNFLFWGAGHGIGLVMLHLWRIQLPKIIAIGFTFLYISLLWVLFFSSI
jgi:D-alanyl-lipoteichoic acid acyltransferase DltB (MBOAT superfamily)